MQKLCRVGASGKKALVITNLANGWECVRHTKNHNQTIILLLVVWCRLNNLHFWKWIIISELLTPLSFMYLVHIGEFCGQEEPQNSIPAVWWWCGSVGFISAWPSACTGAVCSRAWKPATLSLTKRFTAGKTVQCSIWVGKERQPQGEWVQISWDLIHECWEARRTV